MRKLTRHLAPVLVVCVPLSAAQLSEQGEKAAKAINEAMATTRRICPEEGGGHAGCLRTTRGLVALFAGGVGSRLDSRAKLERVCATVSGVDTHFTKRKDPKLTEIVEAWELARRAAAPIAFDYACEYALKQDEQGTSATVAGFSPESFDNFVGACALSK